MNWLVWLLRLLVFVLVLLFALNNTAPVGVTFYADVGLHDVPLIAVMLASFIIGAVFVWLLAVPTALRHRRELGRLQRELEKIEKTQERLAQQMAENRQARADRPTAPDAVAPLAPL